MIIQVAIFGALLVACFVLFLVIPKYPEETFALFFIGSVAVFLWFFAGYLAEVFA